MLRRPNTLDRMLMRWQHSWETSPQFRAAWSGVAGLVIVVGLCACMGVVFALVNTTLSGLAGASGRTSAGTPDANGSGQVGAAQSFPTFTAPSLPPPAIPPAGKIPNSQTPLPSPSAQPTATDAPTATPCAPNCGGGGTVTGFPTPGMWTGGQPAQFTVHTSSPNVGLAIVITFPGGGTYLDENGEQTDGNGNYTSSFRVPSGIGRGKADVWVQANFPGDPTPVSKHFRVDCQP